MLISRQITSPSAVVSAGLLYHKRADASEILVNSFSYACLCSASFGMDGACMPTVSSRSAISCRVHLFGTLPDARKTDLVSYGMLMVLPFPLSLSPFLTLILYIVHSSCPSVGVLGRRRSFGSMAPVGIAVSNALLATCRKIGLTGHIKHPGPRGSLPPSIADSASGPW
jgi:hypothetical protein